MGTVKVTVKDVRAYAQNDVMRYRMSFVENIDAIVKNDNGDYVEGKANYIDFVPSVLLAQCMSCVDGLAYLYGRRKEQGLRDGNDAGFTAADLTIIISGAKMELKRIKFVAGEEYANADGEIVGTHDHDGYSTEVVTVTLTEASQARMNRVIDKALGL